MHENPTGRPPSPALKAAAKMPVLDHFHKGRPFDIMESDVAEWLCQQPEIRQALFNYYKRNGLIVYVDGRWVGATTYNELNERGSSPSSSESTRISRATCVK